MVTLKCEACGAPLSVDKECDVAICKYCGTQTIIGRKKNIVIENTASAPLPDNSLVLSIPSCGATVFQKKTFNIYRRYAELVDVKTGQVDQRIDYQKVVKYYPVFGTNIIFIMSDRQKVFIKCLWNSKEEMVIDALNRVM